MRGVLLLCLFVFCLLLRGLLFYCCVYNLLGFRMCVVLFCVVCVVFVLKGSVVFWLML